ncbi:MAG: GNAT family N-acetyltransferase [Acidobacteriota bacterium]|nr:MAG: GNAT family N-acetyltransferase [Acidobacteriota bacterium]
MTSLSVKRVDHSESLLGVGHSVAVAPNLSRLSILREENREEVLEFLKARPVHTVVMASFLKDNGFESEFNRGSYYGYRAEDGKLEGVALIGHSTLIEARSEDALAAFAIQAGRSETPIHVMMSEGRAIERFWELFKSPGAEPKHVFTEKLFELRFPFLIKDCEWEIRPARIEELQEVAEAHAEVAFIESGTDPMQADPDGFLKRCARRIEQGRTFVAVENGKLLFKADIVAETQSVIYLEGVYVAPDSRGKGVGPKCLSNLSGKLLERAQNVCMLSNLKFEWAHRSFEKSGYHSTDSCTTIFV